MISIVIPIYNHAEYISEAIESALAQTIPCEIIAVNDGSTDNSLEITKTYEQKGVKAINQVNKGLPSARNTGIMNATGSYVLFLDADDVLLENYVERILEKIKETDADVISSSFKEFGVSNREVILIPNPQLEDFKIGNRIGYCSAVKKEALLEVGGYNPKMIFGAEDFDLWHDLLKRGKKIVTIQEVLWLYRTKENSMWTETAKHKEEYMEQIRKNHPEIYA